MQSLNIAQEFCKQAGFSYTYASGIPSWFFASDDRGQKEFAIWVDQVWVEASKLQKCFHDSIVPTIKDRFPKLYEYVMEDQPVNTSFLHTLGQQYKQPTVVLNLSVLMNEIREEYAHYLDWAQDPMRYQLIIDGIRGDMMMQAMELDKTTRYITGIQNRILKGITGLVGLKQFDAANDMRVLEQESNTLEQCQAQDKSGPDDDALVAA